jgi:OOP family OmpA-OmpF porin
MKKIYTLLLFTTLMHAANSQMRLGIMGGPHSSSVIEKNYIPDWANTTEPYYAKRSGIHLGLIGEIPLGYSNKCFFNPGILYMSKGRKFSRLYDTTRVKTDTLYQNNTFYTNYIEVPLNVTLKLRMGKKSSFLLSAGPYFAFFYNGKQSNETRVAINDSAVHFTSDES